MKIRYNLFLQKATPLLLLTFTTMSFAQGIVVHQSGGVKSVTKDKIILEYQGETHVFVINDSTKFCVDGFEAKSWRELLGTSTVTVTTEINQTIALRIDNRPLESVLSLTGMKPIIPECKSKSQSAKYSRSKKLQSLLRMAGYDPGPIDGLLGPRTQKAIQTFQQNQGYPVTGQPSEELLEQLEKAVNR